MGRPKSKSKQNGVPAKAKAVDLEIEDEVPVSKSDRGTKRASNAKPVARRQSGRPRAEVSFSKVSSDEDDKSSDDEVLAAKVVKTGRAKQTTPKKIIVESGSDSSDDDFQKQPKIVSAGNVVEYRVHEQVLIGLVFFRCRFVKMAKAEMPKQPIRRMMAATWANQVQLMVLVLQKMLAYFTFSIDCIALMSWLRAEKLFVESIYILLFNLNALLTVVVL